MGQQPLAVYANVFKATFGPYDVTLDFGHVLPEQAAQAGEFAPHIRVAMSHSHAKSMAQLLLALVEQYERQVGPVPTPPVQRPG
jgi:hypothetical protein